MSSWSVAAARRLTADGYRGMTVRFIEMQHRFEATGTELASRCDAMDRELRMTVLRRAADITGGSSALQQRLDVEQHALELWLSGRATVPEWVFMRAVDLVVRDDIARAAQDRRATPREEREPPESEIARS